MISSRLKITAPGDYLLNKNNSASRSIVYVSGAAGGATLTLSHGDADGNMTPLVDGLVISGEQYKVEHGAGKHIYLVVAGGTGIDLNVETIGQT